MAHQQQAVQQIVTLLNQPPLSKGLTRITLDEKKPIELLQLLNDVFGKLSAEQDRILREETAEVYGPRMVQFLLTILNYKPPGDREEFVPLFEAGNRNVVYPALLWVLINFSKLEKRVYLSRYLLPIAVPPEILAQSDDLQAMYRRYYECMDRFKEVHKAHTQIARQCPEIAAQQQRLTDLTAEKQQLEGRVGELRKRLQDTPNLPKILTAAAALRVQQEAQNKLEERLPEQKDLLIKATQRLDQARKRSAAQQAAPIQDPVDALEEKVRGLRVTVSEELIGKVQRTQKRLDELTMMLMDSLQQTKDDVMREVSTLRDDIAGLEKQEQARQKATNDPRLGVFRQQAAIVAQRLEERKRELEHATRRRDELQETIEAKEKQLSEMPGGPILKGDEYKKYANQLRGKNAIWKRMKGELAALHAELGVLDRTVEILKSRDANLEDFLKRLEERQGVSGHREAQRELQEVSTQKSALDQMKGKTLEEISRIVVEINDTIRKKRAQLSPMIRDLRAARERFHETDTEYKTRQSEYQRVLAGLESDIVSLQGDMKQYRDAVTEEESQYHTLRQQLLMLQVMQYKGSRECKLPEGFKSMQELYQHNMQRLQSLSQQLREQQKHIKENHESNARARAQFQDLKKLLELKLRVSRQQLAEHTQAPGNLTPLDFADMTSNVQRMIIE
eukprot:gnl/Trimastix_PCT/2992.p1 GENE.gnl/Trimastix_PCT/2992~~gnl/Trimastix_PCT/2992.p1  ORF type:complete len:677 (+),score=261.50 gnl/Trimastix_PCT/2992:65-2095(+)